MPNSDTLTARQAMLALSALPRLGPVTIRRLLAAFGNDPLAILRAPSAQLLRVQRVGAEIAQVVTNWREHVDPLAMEAKLARSGVAFITLQDAAYPPPLRHIYDPPVGLYCKGPLRPGVKSVAIVGSRRTTLYGQSTAQMLGRELAALGFCVVSGMARGIDTAAHKGALAAGGETVAVLGNGVDIVYPPENIDIYQQIAERGAVISELPLGTRASRTTFPMRNRLISGLSAAVIVVETDKQGGSMITARFAAEHNRPLFAVPGRIDSSTSQGCNQLIREGAILLSSVDDLIEELAYGGAPRSGHGVTAMQGGGEATGADAQAEDNAAGASACDAAADTHGGQLWLSAEDEAEIDAQASGGILVSNAEDLPRSAAGGVHVNSASLRGAAAGVSAPVPRDAPAPAGLGADEAAVLALLRGHGRMDRDGIARHSGLPVAKVSASLLLLELRRCVVKRADGSFEAHA